MSRFTQRRERRLRDPDVLAGYDPTPDELRALHDHAHELKGCAPFRRPVSLFPAKGQHLVCTQCGACAGECDARRDPRRKVRV